MCVRKWAVKAWEIVSHADTAFSVLSLFPFRSAFAIMTGLIPAVLAIGSVPAWIIAILVLVGLTVVTALLLLITKLIEWLESSGKMQRRIAKKQKRTDESETQQLREELRQAKKNHAEAKLRWCATLLSIKIERARESEYPLKDIQVTVRFAEYKDFDLAKEIATIINKCTQWHVEVDGSNKPTIIPCEDFKVVFNIGPLRTFEDVAWAFNYGELVKGKIGWNTTEGLDGGEHLIVNVIPTVTQ